METKLLAQPFFRSGFLWGICKKLEISRDSNRLFQPFPRIKVNFHGLSKKWRGD